VSGIRLLSFDLDDTLWPCEPTILAAEKKLYRWMQVNAAEITARLSIEQLRVKRLEFIQRHPEIEHDLSVVRIESLKALADEFDMDDHWVDAAFQLYFEARQDVSLFEDVKDILDQLQKNYRLVAVSNGNADIVKTGVGHWFEFSVSAAEVGHRKPHPAIFEKVVKKSGLSVKQIVHIGDDPHNDIYAASQSGIRSVWLNRNGDVWDHEACRADYIIRNLSELPVLLQNI